MGGAFPSPGDLLPHRPPMVLLDEVLDYGEAMAKASLTIHAGTAFFEPDLGVPAHVGIEWMAQTCGIFAGLEARAADRPIRLGFLLGTRRYQSMRSWFALGERPVISVDLAFREEGMAVFDCRIAVADAPVATARLTLYQPDGEAPSTSDQSME
ncbi:hypothetical protein [Telmatospirillum siberiense]|uniref:3-hydroxylacyl-ACP dehydratase n=1 Tax=Telmatospirillum siberiense TaxID=382514 RepID=A0A2N3PW18_9PROT|nr:hypothetical protein [Telmatospirillum siberiense]PKU24602.1 hypothetical protein CWS72_10910 [Telmatospirillum siberiense]